MSGFGLIKALEPRAAFPNRDKILGGFAPADPTPPLVNSDVYYHECAYPVSSARLLGTFKIDQPVYFKLALAVDTDVALRTIGRNARGLKTVADVREAEPDIVKVKGLGGGGAGSITLKQNDGYSYGSTVPSEPTINFLQSFRLVDDPANLETDLYTYGVPTGMLNARTDYNASGVIAVTTGNIASSSHTLTCAARLDLQPGQGIYVAGAGPGGAALVTTISSVSADGLTFVVTTAAGTTVTGAVVQADDTAAIQAWINAKGDLWLPPGYYRLSSSIVLPTTSEGFSIIIHGSGWDVTVFAFQHGGDGFIPTSDLRIDSVCFLDLTVSTGTVGDTGGTIDANSKGIGLRMTAPSYSGVYDQLVLSRCRFIGWGRWAIWSDNLEVSWVSECIFRENKGHVAWVGPDTISPNKQPNANTLTNCTFDQGQGVNDSHRTASGTMSSGSRTLNASGFTAADRGKFVIVHGAATSAGDLFSFIDVVNSSSSVTLAHQAQVGFSGTVEIFQTNVASILLNRANDTVIDGATIQGNFVGCSATADVNAIKVFHSANLRFVGIHEEDNAGYGGAALLLTDCQAVSIENWGGTSAGAGLTNAHGADFRLSNAHGVRVAQSFFNDRPQFVIDSSSSEVEIDNSWVVGYINLWQQDASWDRLRIGSGVRIYQSADPRTNQVAGSEYIYDSLFGRDLIINGRFLDGSGGNEGWTVDSTATSAGWWSNPFTALTRYGSYIKFDVTGIADSGVPTTVFHQAVAIPDSLPAGLFTLAFDWYIETQSGTEQSGRFVEVRLHPSTGIDEAIQFTTRNFTFVMNTWQTGQVRCWLNTGTSRTIDVQMNVTPGPNVPVMRITNLRLTPGKHSFGSYERAVHDFGGRMRAPLEFEPISSVTYPPPASGSSLVSLANIAGQLKIGSGGAYAVIGGTPDTTANYTWTGTNTFSADKLVFASGTLITDFTNPLDVVDKAYVDAKFASGAGITGTGTTTANYITKWVTPNATITNSNISDTGTIITCVSDPFVIQTTTSSTDTTDVWWKTATGVNAIWRFQHASGSLNDGTNTSGEMQLYVPGGTQAFYAGANSVGSHGGYYVTPMSTYTGSLFEGRLPATGATVFQVDSAGNLAYIKGRTYSWPATTPVPAANPKVLSYSSQTGGVSNLAWIDMPGSVTASGTLNSLPRVTVVSPYTLGDSAISDDGSNVTITNRTTFVASTTADTSPDFTLKANSGNTAIFRYQHVSGSLTDSTGNSTGEIQLFLPGGVLCMAVGQATISVHGGIYVTPLSGYSTGSSVFESRLPGTGTGAFRVTADGNISLIRQVAYTWPSAIPSGGPFYLSSTAAGILSWATAASSGVTGTSGSFGMNNNYFTKWQTAGAAGTITNAPLFDNGTGTMVIFPTSTFLGGSSTGALIPGGGVIVDIGTTSSAFRQVVVTTAISANLQAFASSITVLNTLLANTTSVNVGSSGNPFGAIFAGSATLSGAASVASLTASGAATVSTLTTTSTATPSATFGGRIKLADGGWVFTSDVNTGAVWTAGGGAPQWSAYANGVQACAFTDQSNAVFIRVGGIFKQIEMGSTDTAGTGYRVLRVAN